MKELEELAEKTRKTLNLRYDDVSVKYLEDFIERIKGEFPEDQWKGIINSCGSFLGQCIIINFGGCWAVDENGYEFIKFDDKNGVYPISKVSKLFYNGREESIYGFYTIIPLLFEIETKPKPKKWWQIFNSK